MITYTRETRPEFSHEDVREVSSLPLGCTELGSTLLPFRRRPRDRRHGEYLLSRGGGARGHLVYARSHKTIKNLFPPPLSREQEGEGQTFFTRLSRYYECVTKLSLNICSIRTRCNHTIQHATGRYRNYNLRYCRRCQIFLSNGSLPRTILESFLSPLRIVSSGNFSKRKKKKEKKKFPLAGKSNGMHLRSPSLLPFRPGFLSSVSIHGGEDDEGPPDSARCCVFVKTDPKVLALSKSWFPLRGELQAWPAAVLYWRGVPLNPRRDKLVGIRGHPSHATPSPTRISRLVYATQDQYPRQYILRRKTWRPF
ncbi:hypothetical protein PUN28_000211 [Cardiocondyla obscurior]|uniref:Uncharacterized protein n=1 Tax=Cardiocondyla obscurior TaxID=286306 RepID=A0AAW2GY98_9HYME